VHGCGEKLVEWALDILISQVGEVDRWKVDHMTTGLGRAMVMEVRVDGIDEIGTD